MLRSFELLFCDWILNCTGLSPGTAIQTTSPPGMTWDKWAALDPFTSQGGKQLTTTRLPGPKEAAVTAKFAKGVSVLWEPTEDVFLGWMSCIKGGKSGNEDDEAEAGERDLLDPEGCRSLFCERPPRPGAAKKKSSKGLCLS